MSVTAYDARFSHKQDAIARLGDRAKEHKKMSAEEWEHFQHSPFMQSLNAIEELVLEKTATRDKKRARRDPSFQPQDGDWSVPRQHKYDVGVSYYEVLGCDEYAPQDEVKRAYKQLSLIYHPDKTFGMSQKQKEEYQQIFMELKAAQKTLADNPTRRQYDKDRDGQFAAMEVNGIAVKSRPHFDGTEVRKKLAADRLAPSETQEVPVTVRLEKFACGGIKTVRRTRAVREGERLGQEACVYHLHVPLGSEEPFFVDFEERGDEHLDRRTDHLRFAVSSRRHEAVDREGQDIVVREPVVVPVNAYASPTLRVEAASVRGCHVLLWGRNPFFRDAGTGTGRLLVSLRGAGISPAGSLRFQADLAGTSAVATADDGRLAHREEDIKLDYKMRPDPWKKFKVWQVVGGGDKGGILARQGQQLKSPELPFRLATGSFIKELALEGGRLHYELLEGDGPKSGWVSLKLKDADLVARTDSRPWDRIEEAAGPSAEVEVDEAPQPPGAHGRGGLADAPAMRRRLQRWREREPACKLDLEPCGAPVPLFSQPSVTLSFYANRRKETASDLPAGRTSESVFAILVSSKACSSGKLAHQWYKLHKRLFPLLQRTAFLLFRPALGLLPRPLAAVPAEPTVPAEGGHPTPWKAMGDAAFRDGGFWLAAACYSRALEELPAEGWNLGEERARLHSNRAACYARAGCLESSLQDARLSTELRPEWSRAWGRVGYATVLLGEAEVESPELRAGHFWEAREAYARAAQLEPAGPGRYAELLASAAERAEPPGMERALEEWRRGDIALRGRELGEAVEAYTQSLALLPRPAPDLPPEGEGDGEAEGQQGDGEAAAADPEDAAEEAEAGAGAAAPDDEYEWAQERSKVLCRRASAFLRLRAWGEAAADARRAAAEVGSAGARCLLGAALLGCRRYEDAYEEFAKALRSEEGNEKAKKGRDACLCELLCWHSEPARARFQARYALDVCRPRATTKVFAVSDLHLDDKSNEEWANLIDSARFQDDVLIVAGNVADKLEDLVRCLKVLCSKFRRVFFTPGNHELWLSGPFEAARYPDSVAKLLAILEACDEIGVDTAPAPVSDGVFVAPLLSWYTAEFDVEDPFADPKAEADQACRWPIDRHEGVWRYMLKLNEAHLGFGRHGSVITFSHFLPRSDLPFHLGQRSVQKSMGCGQLEDQLRSVQSRLHVYGHSRHAHAEAHDGAAQWER